MLWMRRKRKQLKFPNYQEVAEYAYAVFCLEMHKQGIKTIMSWEEMSPQMQQSFLRSIIAAVYFVQDNT